MRLANSHDDFHIMFDQQDRQTKIVAQALDLAHQVVFFLRVHSCRRFIQQQKLGRLARARAISRRRCSP